MRPTIPPDGMTPISVWTTETGDVMGRFGYELAHPRDWNAGAEAHLAKMRLAEEFVYASMLLAGTHGNPRVESNHGDAGEAVWDSTWPSIERSASATVITVTAKRDQDDPETADTHNQRTLRALQVAAHAHWMEPGATLSQTVGGARISSTEFLGDTVLVQIGMHLWTEMVGKAGGAAEEIGEWVERCERYIADHSHVMPGRAWKSREGRRLAAAGSCGAPRTLLVLDDATGVEEVEHWMRLVALGTPAAGGQGEAQ